MDSYSKYRTMEEARPATEAYKKAHAASMHRSALAQTYGVISTGRDERHMEKAKKESTGTSGSRAPSSEAEGISHLKIGLSTHPPPT